MNRSWMIAVVAALVVSGSACSEKKVSASTRERIPVRAYVVDWTQSADEQRYAAITEPETRLDLAFQAGGVVASIYRRSGRALEAGDTVPAGAVLAQLRITEYQARSREADAQWMSAQASKTAAEANEREARTGWLLAQEDLRRAQALFDARAMTKADMDAVRARHDGAEARLAAAQTNVTSSKGRIDAAAATRDGSRVPLSDTTIRAPFPAVIVARKIEQGSSVAPGTVAYTLADLHSVKLSFGIADTALGQFAAGTKMRMRVDALPGPEFTGRVLAVAPEADPVNRLFRATVSVDNSSGLLKAGMVASVARDTPEQKRELTVPLRAIRRLDDQENNFAVLAIRNETAELQKVTLGAARGLGIAVLSGLKAGDLVVDDGGAKVNAGDLVTIVR
jgi:RND family efflux transporter MFP subunit